MTWQFSQLHKSVSARRKLLTATGRPDQIKTPNRFGYGLQVSVGDLDMLIFNRLVEQAEAAKTARRTAGQTHFDLGDSDRALEMFRRAESMARSVDQARVLAQTRYAGRVALSIAGLEERRRRPSDRLVHRTLLLS